MNTSQQDDGRLVAPAAERNKDAIRDRLVHLLGDPAGRTGCILEIASGTGQHAAHCAPALAPLLWVPSDPDPDHRTSILAWASALPPGRVAEPLNIDTTAADWRLPGGLPPVRAVFCANMIHIAPWAACTGLISGAARHLAPGGRLILYGPFCRGGIHTAESNAAFDGQLRSRDPAWGVRDLDDVEAAAARAGFGTPVEFEMPANNLMVAFSLA